MRHFNYLLRQYANAKTSARSHLMYILAVLFLLCAGNLLAQVCPGPIYNPNPNGPDENDIIIRNSPEWQPNYANAIGEVSPGRRFMAFNEVSDAISGSWYEIDKPTNQSGDNPTGFISSYMSLDNTIDYYIQVKNINDGLIVRPWAGASGYDVVTWIADGSATQVWSGQRFPYVGSAVANGYLWYLIDLTDNSIQQFGWVRGDFIDLYEFNADDCDTQADCPEPTNLSVSNISENSVTLNWNGTLQNDYDGWDIGVYDSDNDEVFYENNWESNSIVVPDLISGETYTWEVRTDCDSDRSEYVEGTSFTTTTPTCSNPTSLNYDNITSTSVTLEWNGQLQGGWDYRVRVYNSSGSIVRSENNWTSNSIEVSNLTSGETYTWRVRIDCDSDSSDYVDGTNFTTTTECTSPTVTFSPPDPQLVPPVNYTFNAITTGNPTSVLWEITGNNGTITRTTFNPTISLPAATCYDVKITVENDCDVAVYDETCVLSVLPDYSNPVTEQETQGNDYPTTSTADPISTASIKWINILNELFIIGKGVILPFTHKYISGSDYNGLMGKSIYPSVDIWIDIEQYRWTLYKGDGAEVTFVPYQNGTSLPLHDVTMDSLHRHANGKFTLYKMDGSEWDFRSDGKIESKTDRNGNTTTWTYNASYIQIDVPGGRWLRCHLSGDKISSLQDNSNRTVSFSYTGDKLTGVTDVNGNPYSFVWDADGNIKEWIDQRSNTVIDNTYDAQHRVTRQIVANGDTTTLLSDTPIANALTVNKPGNRQEIFYHNINLETDSIVDEMLGVHSMNYENHRLIGTTNEDGMETYMYRDNDTRAVDSVVGPEGYRMTNINNNIGLPIEIEDALGRKTIIERDDNHNLVLVIGPKQDSTRYIRNMSGQIEKIIDPLGYETEFVRDNTTGDVLQVITLDGTYVYTYTPEGWVETVTYPDGKTETYQYSNYGNITRIDYAPSGYYETFGYDENGNLTSFQK